MGRFRLCVCASSPRFNYIVEWAGALVVRLIDVELMVLLYVLKKILKNCAVGYNIFTLKMWFLYVRINIQLEYTALLSTQVEMNQALSHTDGHNE